MCPSIFNDYEMSIMGCVQRAGLAAGLEFNACPAQNR